MPYQVVFQRLAFQKTQDDDPTIPDGPETILTRGERLPAWVPMFHVTALENAGMIQAVGDNDPSLVPDSALPEQVRTPEMPPVLPSDPNGTPPLLGDLPAPVVVDVTPVEQSPSENVPTSTPLPPLPKASESKEVWEAYAQRPQIGMTEADAEAMNKTDLIAAVRQRAEAASK